MNGKTYEKVLEVPAEYHNEYATSLFWEWIGHNSFTGVDLWTPKSSESKDQCYSQPAREPKKYGIKYDVTQEIKDDGVYQSLNKYCYKEPTVTVTPHKAEDKPYADAMTTWVNTYGQYLTDTTNWFIKESKMQVYDYVIVRTNKKGEFKDIDNSGQILAKSEERAKILLLNEYDYTELDRLEVLVRPF